MRKRLKKFRLWLSRKSHLTLGAVGGAMILLLCFNEETSISRNMEYAATIKQLNADIKAYRDSAAYFRRHREALTTDVSNLEHLARERYHMQRPTEDVFLLSGAEDDTEAAP